NTLEGGRHMKAIRKAGWFFSLALMMACLMGVLGSIPGEALAGVIASHGADGVTVRDADLGKLQAFLEQKIVLQKLTDYGVSAEEARGKIRSMSDADLHRLASLSDRAAEGADNALGFLIGVAILIILIVVIVKLMNKEIVIR
ncbi:MAG: PA2779 family protein, partial [Candidatus Deferrimicrobiaceae bacterium]